MMLKRDCTGGASSVTAVVVVCCLSAAALGGLLLAQDERLVTRDRTVEGTQSDATAEIFSNGLFQLGDGVDPAVAGFASVQERN